MTEKKRLIIKLKKPDLKNLKLKKPNLKDFNIKKLNWKRILRTSFYIFLVFMILGTGAAIGVYKAIMQNLPDISQLEEFEPKIITYIYAEDDEVIGEYATEKRIEVEFEDIPEILIKAIIATEDPRFYSHKGVDYLGILRAIKADLKLIFTPRKLHGGSTITQQLIRELLLHRRQELRRKIKEAILARQIERRYTKEEILAFYCNQFNLGSGAHGVEAASRLYFDKSVSELTLEEAALITGIFRGPSLYSPYNNPDLTLQRRNHVLNRMVDEKVISEEEAEEAKGKPLGVLPRYRNVSEFAAYFKEEVRKYIEQNYGADALYYSGLRVYTTLDPALQGYAEEALVNQLHALDKGQGWRDDKENLLENGLENLDEIKTSTFSSWLKPDLPAGKIVDAVVLSADNRQATVKIKDYLGTMDNSDIFEWTRSRNLDDLIQRGDVIKVKIKEVDEENKKMQVS